MSWDNVMPRGDHLIHAVFALALAGSQCTPLEDSIVTPEAPPSSGPSPAAPASATPGTAVTATTAPRGGIAGRVFIGPACPGPMIESSPCPDKPYQATIAVLDQNHSLVTSFEADTQGYFRVELDPGTYTLVPRPPDVMTRAPEQTVAVVSGRFVSVTITYDTGIR